MATISIPFFRAKPGRGGTTRYFWDPSSPLRAQGWTTRRLADDLAEAMAEARTINAEVERWRLGAGGHDTPRTAPEAGTLSALIKSYKASRQFTRLAAKTRYDYDYNLAILEEWAGGVAVSALKRGVIREFYDPLFERTPHQANYAMRALRIVLGFAVEQEWIEANPMTRFRLAEPPRATEPKIWSEAQIEAFVAAADALGRPSIGTAVMLNAWLGQREGDVVRLSRAAYRDGAIWLRQRKTGAEVDLPVDEVPALAQRLREELARSSAVTIIASESTGRPYTEDNFRKTFSLIRGQVPACKGLRFCWLRHTATTRLAEAGCSTSYIGAITGHSDQSIEQIISRYRVRTKKMAVEAFRLRLAAEGGGRR